MRRILFPLVALLAAGLAACDSPATSGPDAAAPAPGATNAAGAPSAGGAATGDPCALITPADAKQVLGADDVAPGKRTVLDHTSSCLYKPVHVPGKLNFSSINVGYYLQPQSAGDAKSMVEQAVDLSDKSKPAKALTGLGDAAYYVPGLHQVFVLKGDRLYYTLAAVKDDAEKKATLAAKLLIGHL
jgi:hypothetical protein